MINLTLGTMTIGEQVFADEASAMIETFFLSGRKEIDTAYVYNEGESEIILGEVLSAFERDAYKLATKVNPRVLGKLDKEAVVYQCNESLKRLGIDYVDILYLHFPDMNSSLESALEGCEELYESGKVKTIGVSNFPSWLMAEAINICIRKKWVIPTHYQGIYNILNRNVEKELKQALKYYNITFHAYNPLAGGLLTGKYSIDKLPVKGRFINRPNYISRYWKQSHFDAIDDLRKTGERTNISLLEMSYRWLAYHSLLREDREDSIIVGASRAEQLNENLCSIDNGPLPDMVLESIENAWKKCSIDSVEYYSFYKQS